MARHIYGYGIVLCVAALAFIGCGRKEPRGGGPPQTRPAATTRAALMKEYQLSGPVAHANLTLFFVHGQDKFKGDNFLTLQEALDQQKLVIKETGNVQELTVSNVGDQPVYIPAGEIIRGGRQDRCLPEDIIVMAGVKDAPLSSFCVEQGRWSARAGEASTQFSKSTNALPSAKLLKAAVKERDQQGVWSSVAEAQRSLASSAGEGVININSASSLELTMDSDALNKALKEYQDALGQSLQDRQNVVGLATAVNGKIVKVDIYGSSALFRKLYPKLLKTSATEAVAGSKADRAVQMVRADDVWALDAATGQWMELLAPSRIERYDDSTETWIEVVS